jgi:hypothetical protein
MSDSVTVAPRNFQWPPLYFCEGPGFSGAIDERSEAVKNIEEADPSTQQDQVARMRGVPSLTNKIAAAQPVRPKVLSGVGKRS